MKENSGIKVLKAVVEMAKDDNYGLAMSTTLVSVQEEIRGSVIGFGAEQKFGKDVKRQILHGEEGEYFACAFFIKRKELIKYLEKQ